jgi:dipeptidyl aminopeptidase/acylaminoacyl peptidase
MFILRPCSVSWFRWASVLLLASDYACAQQVILDKEDYLTPPAPIAKILTSDAMHNRVALSNLGPDGEHFLVSKSGGMPPLERFARPYANLGETAIDHNARRSRSLTTGYTIGYELHAYKSGGRISVNAPEGTETVSGGTFSPDGSKLAFAAHAKQASFLYVFDIKTAKTRRITEIPMLATFVSTFRWTWDSQKILAVLMPEGSEDLPARPPVSPEPTVWVTHDGKTPARTYRFLLKTSYDKLLLEHLATGQLSLVTVESGEVSKIGSPAMFTAIDVSPTGRFYRVTTMQKPFSYFVPTRSFGTKDEMWDYTGKTIHQFSERKLRVGSSSGGRGGQPSSGSKRSITWRPDGRGMSFLEREPEKPKADEKSKDGAKDGDKAAVKSDAKPKAKGSKKPAPKAKGSKKPAPKAKDSKKPAPKAKPKAAKKATGKAKARAKKKSSDKVKGTAKKRAAARAKNRNAKKKSVAAKGKPKPVADAPKGRAVGGRGGDGRDRAMTKTAGRSGAGAAVAKRKDRVMQWLPPYSKSSVKVVWESEHAIQSVAYSHDCKRLYITQTVDGVRKVFAIDLANPGKHLKIHEKKSPGSTGSAATSQRRGRRGRGSSGGRGLMSKAGFRGGRAVRTSKDKKHVYLSGSDEPKDKKAGVARAYVDRIAVGSGEAKRVWQQPLGDIYESFSLPTDDDFTGLIVQRESVTEVPNTYLRNAKTGKLERLTDNVDPAPGVTKAKRMRFQVERVDGFKFWVKVAIPPNHGSRLPALFWFYPREFTSQAAYDSRQRTPATNRFPSIRTRSMEMLTLMGYVVVAPDCPIVGEEGRMNDNFVGDLRNSLWAVVDDLDRREIIDRSRLAIGGHSYGAFGTANALAHTPFFKAGIAGDGNYNRTLTPMSFQSERRSVWEARETYLRMSPLLWANQVNGALLMYHGMDDNNTGTFPIHSPRMFQALDGLGKEAALYMYPYEGHGPGADATILDLWSRWVNWLDIHVKNAGRAKAPKKPAKAKTSK